MEIRISLIFLLDVFCLLLKEIKQTGCSNIVGNNSRARKKIRQRTTDVVMNTKCKKNVLFAECCIMKLVCMTSEWGNNDEQKQR